VSHTEKPLSSPLREPPSLSLALDGDERWELVGRISSSKPFKRAPRLQRFLLFVAERSLTGHPEEITEYEIGWKVFERREDYNPSDDSIVRTTARQLLTKVKEYFDSEGTNESWNLEIPKGGYLPIFTKRKAVAATPETSLPEATASRSAASALRLWRVIAAALAAVAVCSLGLAYQLWRTSGEVLPTTGASIVSSVLGDGLQPTRVIVGDYGAVLMSLASGRYFSVEEYANRSYASSAPPSSDPLVPNLWGLFGNGQAVSLPDLMIVGNIVRLSAEGNRPPQQNLWGDSGSGSRPKL
jgi:hypothetical protein